MKYLDLTGLQKFWAKVKNHVQNSLKGYVKNLSGDSGHVTIAGANYVSLETYEGQGSSYVKVRETADISKVTIVASSAHDESVGDVDIIASNSVSITAPSMALNGASVATKGDMIPYTSYGCYSPEFTVADLISQLTNEGVTTISGQPVIVSFDGMVSGTFLCRFNNYHTNYYGCEFTDLKNLETFYFEGESSSLSIYNSLSSANKQLSLNDLNNSRFGTVVEATSTDGVKYTATVDGLSELYVGASIIIIPDKTSTNMYNVSLNVNGLGAKAIKRWDNLYTHEYWSFKNADWFRAGYPIRVMFNGTYWIIEGMNKPYATDLNGVVPVANGGVPSCTTSDNGKVLKVVNGVPTWTTA